MTRLLLLALALSACSPGGYCLTDAGLILMSPGSPGVCQRLQVAENTAIEALGQVPGWTPGYVTSRLEGVEIYLEPTADAVGEWFEPRVNENVRGLTDCRETRIGQSVAYEEIRVTLGKDDFLDVPFPHEMAHVVEPCLATGHEDWKARGIEAAVLTAAQN